MYQMYVCQTRLFSSSLKHISPLLVQVTSDYVDSALVCGAIREALCTFFLLHWTTGIYFFFPAGPGPPHEKRSFRVFT